MLIGIGVFVIVVLGLVYGAVFIYLMHRESTLSEREHTEAVRESVEVDRRRFERERTWTEQERENGELQREARANFEEMRRCHAAGMTVQEWATMRAKRDAELLAQGEITRRYLASANEGN